MKVFYEYWNYFFIFKISNKFEKWPKTFFWGGAELDEKGIKLNSRDYFTNIKTLNICQLCFEFDYRNWLPMTPNLGEEDPITYLKLGEY